MALIGTEFVDLTTEGLYYWLRVVASIVSVASYGYLVVLAYRSARRLSGAWRRFVFAIVVTLGFWTLILAFLAGYALWRNLPIPVDPIQTGVSVFLSLAIAGSGLTLCALFPRER